MKILIIEDDAQQAAFVSRALTEAGHRVDHASNGQDGLSMAQNGHYDALLVDCMLPRMDGLSVIANLRGANNTTPALVVSALSRVDDRVRGLRAGGDDYIVKPFAIEELLARIDAVARRSRQPAEQTRLQVADLEMDLITRKVTRGGVEIDLKPREFALLEFLLRHAGRVVTRTMLLEGVWDYHFDPQTNLIDVHISRLRGKIDRDASKALIHTVRGAGYCLRED